MFSTLTKLSAKLARDKTISKKNLDKVNSVNYINIVIIINNWL